MIEAVCLELNRPDTSDVEVETYTYHNRLRSIHDGVEITLFAVFLRGNPIKWMEYSR